MHCYLVGTLPSRRWPGSEFYDRHGEAVSGGTTAAWTGRRRLMRAKSLNLLTFLAQLSTARLSGTGRWVVAKHAGHGGPFFFRSAKQPIAAAPFPYGADDKSWQIMAGKGMQSYLNLPDLPWTLR